MPTPRARTHRLLRPLALIGLLACNPESTDTAPTARGPVPDVAPAAPNVRRLTQEQYRNSVEALVGEGLVLPTRLEPDTAIEGLYSVGAAVTTVSPVGVEQYEDAAFSIAEQVFADADRTGAVAGCVPGADGCLESFVRDFGRRTWRRSLSEDEVSVLVDLGESAAATLGDDTAGLTYTLAALLQSPYFVYRVELGEADPAGGQRYTSVEMASRLAYFLWNTTPDDELLDAGEAGELVTEEGLAAQVERLLGDDRAHDGVRALFSEVFELADLDDLSQDPTLFTHMSPEVGSSAREETLLGIDAIVFGDEDWRTLYTTRRTFLDPVLASLYNVRAPVHEGFGETELDPSTGRAGFLGQASFLALQAHPTATSATLRGKFIREILLCQTIAPPPAGVDTSIPEPDTTSPTLRARLEVHLTDPTCAGCHQLTDPIGLGFENFDAIGMWRLTENGATIDPSGVLDGATFTDAVSLGTAVSEHARLGPCLAETIYRYATARSVSDGEEALVEWHGAGFEESDFRVRALLAEVATSPGFRTVGEVE